MKEALFRADFDTIAQILGKSWKSKKIISDIVSNDELDRIYNLAMENGAYSGKTSGDGAGGFMFFLVDPIKKYNLIKILNQQSGYVQDFSFTKEGAKSWKL